MNPLNGQPSYRLSDNSGGQRFPRSRREIGVIDITGDWERYEASWSGKHRRATKRYMKKLEKEFTVRLERHRSLNPQELEEKMRIAFEIEDRSWKGDAGTSILKSDRMPDHFLREAQQVQDCGCFDLWLLYANDRAIAFEYCHIAFGICSSNKIGYDGEFSKFGPGRILRCLQLKALHEEGECRLFDTFGFFDASKAQWCTRTYPIENLFVSLRPLPNFLLQALTTARPLISCLRNQNDKEVPKLVPGVRLELADAQTYPLSFEAEIAVPAVV